MIDIEELKNKFNKTFDVIKEINECKRISNIIFNFQKLNNDFVKLSDDSINANVFEKIIHSSFDELNKWKENISLPPNMQFNIEKTKEGIGNNTISIIQTLHNTDGNCRTKEIAFNYSINSQHDSLGVEVIAENINYTITYFPMSKDINKELILKEFVETFYDYVHGIKIETWK